MSKFTYQPGCTCFLLKHPCESCQEYNDSLRRSEEKLEAMVPQDEEELTTEEILAHLNNELIVNDKISSLKEELRMLCVSASDAYYSQEFGEAEKIGELISNVRKELRELGVET